MEHYRKIYDFEDDHSGLRPARRKYGRVSSMRFSNSCRTGRSIYDDDTITDQPQRQIVAEMIREKALALSGRGDTARHRGGDRPDAGAAGRKR